MPSHDDLTNLVKIIQVFSSKLSYQCDVIMQKVKAIRAFFAAG